MLLWKIILRACSTFHCRGALQMSITQSAAKFLCCSAYIFIIDQQREWCYLLAAHCVLCCCSIPEDGCDVEEGCDVGDVDFAE